MEGVLWCSLVNSGREASVSLFGLLVRLEERGIGAEKLEVLELVGLCKIAPL